MMSQKQAIQLRGKIVGVLMRDARLASGKSLKEVGEVLGVSGGRIGSFEKGTRSPSLPELELLAYYLEIPVDHFWDEQIVSESSHPIENLDVDTLLRQRNREIGSLLRQSRSEQNLSQRDLAAQSGISAARIRRYESGEYPVPLPELEEIANSLNDNFADFAANSGPVGDWILQQQAIETFLQLPTSLQEFISKPENESYLEMARKLSNMSRESMRAIADGLKELST